MLSSRPFPNVELPLRPLIPIPECFPGIAASCSLQASDNEEPSLLAAVLSSRVLALESDDYLQTWPTHALGWRLRVSHGTGFPMGEREGRSQKAAQGCPGVGWGEGEESPGALESGGSVL